ncbi:MAG: insulinase family protein [Anaerolineaceae bacterium]|nr:insulinase family protein [Anaerolineaceae bacterium]
MNPFASINIQSLPGPDDTRRVVLQNGITVLVRPNPESASVVISGYLQAGSLFESDEKAGLAYFTATALMRGTARRSFQEIFDALESAGASLGLGCSVHTASFGGRALAEDLPLLLELLAESLCEPVFPAEYIERMRAHIMTSLAIRAQDTADMASLTFDRLLFPGHPYGRADEGYPETIAAITRDDIVAFHRRHYGPRQMVLVITGGISPDAALEQVEKALGSFANPDQQLPPVLPEVKPLLKTIRQHVKIPGKSQADLVIGSLGPRRNSDDYLPISLGNNILGQFGMMGRIGDVVREQAGLAYYASTSLNGWIESGSWEVSAGVNPDNLTRATDLILQELKHYIQDGISLEEMQDSQANFIGRLPLSLESNSGVANALLNLERFQLGLDYYRRYPGLVAAVTPEQALEASRRYLDPRHLVIASAGSKKS